MSGQIIRLWRFVCFPLALAAMVGGSTLFAGVGTADAGSWAWVDDTGALLKFKGVTANFRDGAGRYRIIFNRKIDHCVPVATLSSFSIGQIWVLEGNNQGEVTIATYNSAGTPEDKIFYIALVC